MKLVYVNKYSRKNFHISQCHITSLLHHITSLLLHHITSSDDVVTEQAILKWYNDAHLPKGKSTFLEQMKEMVDWLKTAEEESDTENIADTV